MESVSSHELVEAMTDTNVALAQTFAPPLAWYARAGCNPNGENADICNGQQATIMVSGRTHTVQKIWSNRAGACIATSTSTCPFVTSAPAPAAGCLGSDVTFDVVATGGSTTFQWRHAGTPLVDDGVHIIGSQTASLLVSGLVAGDAGAYDVLVGSVSCPTLTTNAAALTVTTDASVPLVAAPAAATLPQTTCQ